MQPILTDLITWAVEAGTILRAGYGQQHQIDLKGIANLVTEIDRRSEEHLIQSIRTKFPEHSIIAEESDPYIGKSADCWYIDPLDGTTNYAHNLPIFSVSIGYMHAGQMMLGVVYDPMRDECFSAERGQGAWLNGHTIHVAPVERLADALMVTGFPYDIMHSANDNIEYYKRFAHCSQGVRRLGSAAIDLCYLAAGRMDGYWELTLKPWDLAAGSLIVAEAGGIVTNLQGGPDLLSPPNSLVAANPIIHPLMLAVLNH